MKKQLLLSVLLSSLAACSQLPDQAPAPVTQVNEPTPEPEPDLVENEVLNDQATQSVATDFGHIFIDRDMSFSGTLSCRNCPGVKYQINLYQDGKFEARQEYIDSPEINLVKGNWLLEERTIHLMSQTLKLPSFQFVSNNKMVLLDEAGKPVVSKDNFELIRSQNFVKLDTSMKMLGLYQVKDNQASFTSCTNGETFSIAMTQHHIPMLRSYQQDKNLNGKAVIATMVARQSPKEDKLVFVEQFEQFWPGASCPDQYNMSKVQGIVWRVNRIKYIQVPQQYNLRMMFNDNARLYGFSGCNFFNGSYSQSSNLLKIDPLVSTRKYCAESNYYESKFTQHLQGADRIELNGDKLQLFQNNEVVVEMSPALN
ncbi:META domain-containing protein [Rheinheimera sp.]|uniref:META domain-containing protein n=1 Tax=Rheinheimera sp. TaxID=1869214 RepID=UPI00307D3103